ncbi:hypothetical protein N7G274_005563 [Stereocaulon virgatum]|uniref:non-specific serine/threonine protein kinase n=1 Tax=Stereocaulon virgatum TaxID=373712 RepID=A0ABR4AAL8_9LECA
MTPVDDMYTDLSLGSTLMDISLIDDGGIYSRQSTSVASGSNPSFKELKRSRFGEVDRFEMLEHVGAGSNGSCLLLKRRSDQALRVCKTTRRIFNYKGEYEKEPLEATILLDILPPHDRISRLHGFVVQPKTVQLYFDYYAEGDLSQLIKNYAKQWESIPEAFMWHAYLQLTEALAFLHTGYNRDTGSIGPPDWTAVIHGDIKPANIFLSPPDANSHDALCRQYPSLVLGDFGLADVKEKPFVGTLKYQPPETPASSQKADVWAVGAVMHCMTFFCAPVSDPPQSWPNTFDYLITWLAKPEARDPMPLYEVYSVELHDVVFEAFTWDPRGRIDSLHLYSKVLKVFETKIAPYPAHVIVPLLSKGWESRLFDQNGCTTNTANIASARILEAQEYEDVDATLVGYTGNVHGCYTTPGELNSGSSGYSTAPEDRNEIFVLPDRVPKFVVPIDWSETDLMWE